MNEEIPSDRLERPDIDYQGGARPRQFDIGNDEAGFELSVESRSFVNPVNDQVRKITEKNFKCYRKWRRTFYDLGNVYGCNDGISCIHGKELPEQVSIHFEHDRSHTKKMFDISTRSVSEQDEISGLETIGWENHSWKYLSLIGDERVINFQRRKVYVFFGFCVMLWEDFRKSWI